MREPKAFIKNIYEMAKKNIERDGMLRGMIFADGPGGVIIADVHELMCTQESKDQIEQIVLKFITAGSTAILMMTEAWMIDDQDAAKDYMANRNKYPNGLSDHPLRKEYVHFNYESAEGPIWSMAPILRTGENAYLGNLNIMEKKFDEMSGRFANFFAKAGKKY